MADTKEEIKLGKNLTRFFESEDRGAAEFGFSLAKGVGISLERITELFKRRREIAIEDFTTVRPVDETVVQYEGSKLTYIWWRWMNAVIEGKYAKKWKSGVIEKEAVRLEKAEGKSFRAQKRKVHLLREKRSRKLTEKELDELDKLRNI